MSTIARVYFDGICEPVNPGGWACGGWYIESLPVETTVVSGGRLYVRGEGATNNVAEYNAALDALRAVYAAGWSGAVELVGDSQLVVKQFSGEWACNKPALQELLAKLKHAATYFESVTAVWVPRAQNALADEESRRAYERATGRTIKR